MRRGSNARTYWCMWRELDGRVVVRRYSGKHGRNAAYDAAKRRDLRPCHAPTKPRRRQVRKHL